MQIAIASGKGGTGKTLIATSLATLWANQGRRVVYVDTDVEEPNGHLFLKP
jgi:MinD superfamily P-loop ATPase